METAQLENKVYAALISDEVLMGFLPRGEKSIYHLQAPSVYPSYPTLIYSPISDVPVLHADNIEQLHRVTIRIHIVTLDGDYNVIYRAIKRIMQGLGFTRVQTTPLMDEERKMLVVDFRIITGG